MKTKILIERTEANYPSNMSHAAEAELVILIRSDGSTKIWKSRTHGANDLEIKTVGFENPLQLR